MTKYVINENNRLYVKKCKGFIPRNNVGILPEGIVVEDYKYLKADPIYDEGNPELVIGYTISVDQTAKDADASNRQQELDDEAMFQLRMKRNILLQETDYTQMSDSPCTEQEKIDYAIYRQALRDLPSTVVDVHNPIYPAKPGSN